MSRLDLNLFGAPTILVDKTPIHFATRKALAILIYLAVTGQHQSRDTLTLLLWPESDSNRARGSLRRALADIKKAIGDGWLIAEADIISLNEQANIKVDVLEFRRLLTADSPQQKTTYTQVLSLYQADFLTGFSLRDSPAFDEWQFFEQEDLRQSLSQLLETLIELHREAEEWEAAITCGRRYVTLDPLHEPAHVKLIQLYAESGQQAAALRQYETCQRILEEELGIEPDTTTTTLYRQIKSHRFHSPGLPELNLQESSKTVAEHNLPTPANAFIGREEERLQIAALLDNPNLRLLTLAGLGGIGKTRLALEAAAGQIGRFEHGVWHIPLEAVNSARELVTTIADTLGFPLLSSDVPQEQLIHHVQDKEMLWLLDNFEHLLDSAPLLSEILSQSPGLKIIATSRETLDLNEEWLFRLEGLPFPSNAKVSSSIELPSLPPLSIGRYSAIQLFTQRALQARHDFSLPTEQRHVIVICQLVEGMPLAIELAAAWVRMLPCSQIVREIKRSLDFLTKTHHKVHDRHQSIRAVFEASWQMLSDSEQHLLAQLSVFRSSFTIDAALTIAEASLFDLYSLVNKSLVQTDGNGRYKLHELLRQFAAEKISHIWPDSESVHERHSNYFHALLQQNQDELFGPYQVDILNNINQDIENSYQAWLWAAQNGQISNLQQSFTTLYQYHAMRSKYQQGERLFEQTINLLEPYLGVTDQETITLLARLTVYRGEYLYTLGRISEAEENLRLALNFTELMGLENERQLATQTLGVITYLQGRYNQARQFLAQALELITTLNDPLRQAYILMTMGAVELALGNYADAQKHHQSSLEMFTDLDYQWGKANALRFLGTIAFRQEHYQQAQVYHQQSLSISQTLNFETGIAIALNNLGLIAEVMDQPERAYQLYQKALTSSQESHTRLTKATSLQNLGRISITLNQPQQGRTFLRQALETAAKAEALPLMLEIMLDIAYQLEADGKHRQASNITALIAQHSASPHEIQLKANQLQSQLPPPTANRPIEQTISNVIENQVDEIINLLA